VESADLAAALISKVHANSPAWITVQELAENLMALMEKKRLLIFKPDRFKSKSFTDT
jgi:hypothetical protein